MRALYQKRKPWFVLAGAMLVYTTLSGTFFYAFGVFLPEMTADLGWSRSAISGGLTLSLLIYGLASPLIGVSINRYGPRLNIIFGSLLAAAGLFATSQCRQVWQFYLCFGVLVGLGTAFGQYLACTTTVNNWFSEKKALAIGLLVSCGGIAGFFFPPLTSWLIEISGWRTAWLIFGALNLSLAVVVGGVILVRDRPVAADRAEVAHGLPDAGQAAPAGDGSKSKPLTLGNLVKLPAFWLIIVLGAANMFGLGAINAHQVAYLVDIGFTAIIAATIYSLVSVMNALGRVGIGALSIHFSVNKLIVLGFILQICAFIIVLTARSQALIYLYAILFGATCGAIWVSIPVLVTEYFGNERFAVVLSWVLPICIVTESIGAVVTGAIYDINQTYAPAFWVMLVFAVVGLAATLLLTARKVKNPK